MKTALITGITGQDGSYLAEFLLAKGYQVYGMVRRSSSVAKTRLENIYHDPKVERTRLLLEYGDLADAASIRRLVAKAEPDEIYNLAAQSHVRISFDQPDYTADITGTGALRMLDAMRDYIQASGRPVRFYQASSSEMFGAAPPPQHEQTPFHPRSPYGVAKVGAFWNTVNYREAYGLHCSNGILFNHESERRGENFVTRKITRAAGRIKVGLQNKLVLGNLDAKRDWGHALDYVEAMWLMLQQETPDDYVVATGAAHSIREFLDEAFGLLDLDWSDYVSSDPYYYRAAEVDHLLGEPGKARQQLGWTPKIDFKTLVQRMVAHDLDQAQREAHAQTYGAAS